jgi:SAM-dependent methyltransferase
LFEVPHDYRATWERKPVLRLVYNDFYDRIAAACVPGIIIEVGGGIGNLKQRLSNVVATDLQLSPWLDLVADAQRLPFAPEAASNIVMVDVLHHLEYPANFFHEAERILRPGGRIVMVEPAITLGSTLFYRHLHHEPVNTSTDPLVTGEPHPERNPIDSNQAIPTLIARKHRARFHALFPGLRFERIDWFSLAVYPMSGGFKAWSLLPIKVARHLLNFERVLEPIAGRFLAFRMLLVIEKLFGPDQTQHGI